MRQCKPTRWGMAGSWFSRVVLAVCFSLVSATFGWAVTVNVVDADGNAVSGFRWLLEEDNTNQQPPQVPTAFSIGLDIHKSHAPVVANGSSATASADISLPDAGKAYFVSVLPFAGYSLGGSRIEPGATDNIQVVVNKHRIPTSQIAVYVFEDNFPINNAPDRPNEHGLAGFSIQLADYFGQVSWDVFGNPLGTTYQRYPNGDYVLDANGDPVVDQLGSGIITTDANGYAYVKNLAPGKYGVTVTPPGSQVGQWIQTATIEGTPTIDAWVGANEPSIFIEGFGTGFTHVAFGFVNPANLPGIPNSGGSPTISITGRNVYNHFARPPYLQGFYSGEPVPECYAALNDPVTGEGLAMVACDDDSFFTIPGVVPGRTYQLVTWDKPLDALFGFNTVVVPPTQTSDLDLGDVLSFSWFGRLEGVVFNDHDKDGVWDQASEPGIPSTAVNIRFRDGSLYKATVTDGSGEYGFAEVFPFFKWLVAEVDFGRFKPTGVTSYVDFGGTLDPSDPSNTEPGPWPARISYTDYDGSTRYRLHPQPQNPADPANAHGSTYSRTQLDDGADTLLQAMHLFLGQKNIIDWGKIDYTAGENGGISGMVVYATTRAEDDPTIAAIEDWEPGIPRVQVALYRDHDGDGQIDDLDGDGGPTLADVDNYPLGWIDGGPKGPEDVDHNNNGLFDSGDALNITHTDSWDDNAPTGCIQRQPAPINGQTPKLCFDNFGTWNQVRPGVFDGGYIFTSYYPGGRYQYDRSQNPAAHEQTGLPTDTYIVAAAIPPGYQVQREEDKNVDFGDSYVPSKLTTGYPQPACVGDLHTVPPFLSMLADDSNPNLLLSGVDVTLAADTASIYAGQQRPLCDRRQVFLGDKANAVVNFHFFTQVPKAARVVGFVNNDLAAEFDPTSPIFGEKSAPAWLPVSFRDWAGNEIVRVYTDEYGTYNALLPSTFTANLPTPSGLSPNMITAVLNDPGPILDTDPNSPTYGQMITDPNYDPSYSITPWTLDYAPGKTTYLDTPLVPVAAFAGYPKGALDVNPPDGTPVIRTVEGPAGDALVCNDDTQQLTLRSLGVQKVDNPNYDPNASDPANRVAQIERDFGFGSAQGTVSVNGTPANVVSWTTDTIVVTVPAGAASGEVRVTTAAGVSSPPGASVLLDCGTANNLIHVPADYPTIQAAVDAATDGATILVAPGVYDENVIVYKPVRLIGAGAEGTVIDANPSPPSQLDAWHVKIRQILGITNGTDPFIANEAPGIMVLGRDTASFPNTTAHDFSGFQPLIEGFTVRGALSGGGIYVYNDAYNLEIRQNKIANNQGNDGGGITLGAPQRDLRNTGVWIHDNLIRKNGGVQGPGGIAIYPGSDNYRIEDNQLIGNFSRFGGGGIGQIGTSSGQIVGNDILFNEVYYGLLEGGRGGGGGIFLTGANAVPNPAQPNVPAPPNAGAGDVTIDGNRIQGNLAGAFDGGGILAFAYNGKDVTDNPGNSALWFGLVIRNNIIVNNVSAFAGGGIALQDVAQASIVNNTVAYNDSAAVAALAFPPGNLSQSTPQPAGIASRVHSAALQTALGAGFSNPLLENNILWMNRSQYQDASINGGMGGLLPASSHPTAPHDDVWDLGVLDTGNPADKLNPRYCILTDTTGYDTSNLRSAPGFVRTYRNNLVTSAILDEGGNFISVRYRELQAGLGDYHLASKCSPAIDKGNPANAPATDIDGDARPQDTDIDIGADEFAGGTGNTVLASLTLLAPNGGELFPANSTQVIRWGAPAGAGGFDLLYRLGPGQPVQTLASGVTDTCYQWTVPGNLRNRDNVQMWVVDTASGDSDQSDAGFVIDALALQKPNGGEVLIGGTTASILWDDAYALTATQVNLYYQVQDATTGAWGPQLLIGQAAPADRRFDWTLPNTSVQLDKVRVLITFWDAAQSEIVLIDASKQPFTILPGMPVTTAAPAAAPLAAPAVATPLAVPASQGGPASGADTGGVDSPLALVVPNGGETYLAGELVPVLWSGPALDTVAETRLEVRYAGGSWQEVDRFPGDPGLYDWVPERSADRVWLRITRLAADGTQIDQDVVDASFGIAPAGQ